jgi:hypothetical protein
MSGTDRYTLNTSVPRSLSSLEQRQSLSTFLLLICRERTATEKVDHCSLPTSRSDTVTTMAIPHCYQLADKWFPQLEARWPELLPFDCDKRLFICSSNATYRPGCCRCSPAESYQSCCGESVLGVPISYCFSLLFHFVPVIQIRLSPVLDIRPGWKIRDYSFLLVCDRYRSLTPTHPIACH